MPMSIADYQNCTGCAACAGICGSGAIEMKEDELTHFYYPQIDNTKCVNCGICQNVCPAIIKSTFTEPTLAYAANNKKIEDRMLSASGGIFRAIASYVLENGGAVAGVRYVGVNRCEHHIVADIKELDELCGTKYFQSESQKVYVELEKHAKTFNLLMFCGTPCQVAAIKRYSKIKGFDDKLFTVEVLCRGISSAYVHQKFLEYLEKRFGKKVISIRYKEKTRGWNKVGTLVTFEDGLQEYVISSENYLAKLAYEMNLSVRESCYTCKYKRKERVADITIGDFWGLNDSPLLDNYGTSFILVNTSRGYNILNRVANKLEMIPHSVETVMAGNKYGFNQISCVIDDRRYLWDKLNVGVDISKVTKDIKKMEDERIARFERTIDRDNRLLGFYERWVVGCSKGENVSGFLIENNFRNIAIFGYGTLGRALRKIVENRDVKLAYIIESNENRWDESVDFYKITDSLPAVDVIIVSAILDYEEIYEKLAGKVNCPIISMEDIIP